jgi:hypothetical protein
MHGWTYSSGNHSGVDAGCLQFYDPGKIAGNPENHPFFLPGDPRQLEKTRFESRYRQPVMMVRDFAREKIPFQEMIAPLAPALPPWGAGAHFATPALPEREIFATIAYRYYGTIVTGDGRAAGACFHALRSVRISKGFLQGMGFLPYQ